MIPPQLTESDVTSSPFVIYVTAAFGLFVIIIGQLPKVATSWTEFLAARRRTATDKDDADIADLRRQVANLTARLEDRDAQLTPHAEWDRKVYLALMRQGEDVGLPPPLY